MIQPLSGRRTAILVLALYLLTGLYTIRVDEQGVVRRFGGVIADHVPPGLHLGLPWGIDTVDRVKVREQKRLSVGFELPDAALGRQAQPGLDEFLTGDQNLVNVELLVQYTVREPRRYLFAAMDGSDAIRTAAEGAVTAAAARRPVDFLLTTGKLEVQDELRRRAQETVDRYGLGVTITAVSISAVAPPVRVADAFRSVSSAREDRDRIIHEAESYASAVIPEARASADQLQEEAAGYRDSKILQATGDAARFDKAYSAYKLSPDLTSSRLYLETVEEILPRMKIISLDRQGGRSPVDLNILPSAPDAKAK